MKKLQSALKGWLQSFDLSYARMVAITGLSRYYHDAACRYLRDFYAEKGLTTVNIYCYYSTEGKLPQSINLDGQKISTLIDLLNCDKIAVFFHDIEDLGSVRRFTSIVRGNLEKSSHSPIVSFTMRPATAFIVYGSGRSPLFGRVKKLEEPSLKQLGIDDQFAKAGGYMDLYRALIFGDVNLKERFNHIDLTKGSIIFHLLDRFWHYLLTDSRRAGLCKVIASCLAAHNSPLRLPEIAEKCGLKQNIVRVLVYSANKTGLLKIKGSKLERLVEIYPPLLHEWIKKNVPFYPQISRT